MKSARVLLFVSLLLASGLARAGAPVPLTTFDGIRNAYINQCTQLKRSCQVEINVYTQQSARGPIEMAVIKDTRTTATGSRITLIGVTDPKQISVDPDTGRTVYTGPHRNVFDYARARSVELPGVAMEQAPAKAAQPSPSVRLSLSQLAPDQQDHARVGTLQMALPPRSPMPSPLEQRLQSSEFAMGVVGAVQSIVAGNTQLPFFSPEAQQQFTDFMTHQAAQVAASAQANTTSQAQLQQSIEALQASLRSARTDSVQPQDVDFEVLGDWISELDTVKYQQPDPFQAVDYLARADQAIAECASLNGGAELDRRSAQQLRALLGQHLVDHEGILTGLALGFPQGKPLLLSSRFSQVGRMTRNMVNQVGASQERVGFLCAQTTAQSPEFQKGCSDFRQASQDVLVGVEILDRMSVQFRADRVQPALEAMEELVQGVRAFAEGAVGGAGDEFVHFSEGLAQLAMHPIDTALQVGRAIQQIDQIAVALTEAVEAGWDDLVSLDPERTGRRVGQLSFMLFENIVTAGTTSAVMGGARVATTALGLNITRKVVAGEVARQTLKKLVQLAPAEVGQVVTRPIRLLSRMYPEFTQKLLPSLGTSTADAKAMLGHLADSAPPKWGGKGMLSDDLLLRIERAEYPPPHELIKRGRNSTTYVPDYADPESVVFRSAEEANSKYFAQYTNRGTAPIKESTVVAEFTTARESEFVRVYTGGRPEGPWLVRKESIRGLSPEEIQRKLSLPEAPTHIVDVQVSKGVRLLRSRAASNFDGDNLAIQYSLLSREETVLKVIFKNARPL